jgi:hypothetical protein
MWPVRRNHFSAFKVSARKNVWNTVIALTRYVDKAKENRGGRPSAQFDQRRHDQNRHFREPSQQLTTGEQSLSNCPKKQVSHSPCQRLKILKKRQVYCGTTYTNLLRRVRRWQIQHHLLLRLRPRRSSLQTPRPPRRTNGRHQRRPTVRAGIGQVFGIRVTHQPRNMSPLLPTANSTRKDIRGCQ